jgi:hypothetical protein
VRSLLSPRRASSPPEPWGWRRRTVAAVVAADVALACAYSLASSGLTDGARVLLVLLGVLSLIIVLQAVRPIMLILVVLTLLLGVLWVVHGAVGLVTAPPHHALQKPSTIHLTAGQMLSPLIQCFADHHLIPAAALGNGRSAHPRNDASTWLLGGKVIANDNFGHWLSEDSDVVIKGRSIGTWMTAIEASPRAWPASLCGPMPRSARPRPARPLPPSRSQS